MKESNDDDDVDESPLRKKKQHLSHVIFNLVTQLLHNIHFYGSQKTFARKLYLSLSHSEYLLYILLYIIILLSKKNFISPSSPAIRLAFISLTSNQYRIVFIIILWLLLVVFYKRKAKKIERNDAIYVFDKEKSIRYYVFGCKMKRKDSMGFPFLVRFESLLLFGQRQCYSHCNRKTINMITALSASFTMFHLLPVARLLFSESKCIANHAKNRK